MGRAAPFLILVPLSILGIFDHELWTPDEPRAAEISREFLEPAHGWAVPTLGGTPFVEKPPLVYWCSALSMKLLGTSAWAARLPCVLFGWGTLLFTYLLARAMYGPDAGAAAALILSTSAGFLLVSHHLESDAGLTCFTAGAAYALYRSFTGPAGWYALFVACLGAAFFSKGFIAFAFLGLLFSGWIVWTRSWGELLRARPWLSLPALAAPIAVWLAALARDPRGDLLRAFVIDNHIGRLLGSAAASDLGHHQPIYYYLPQIPAQFAPWIVGALLWRPRWREPADRFLLLWLVPALLLLTASSTKRGIYLIPLLPPMAILTARECVSRGKAHWVLWGSAGLAGALVLSAIWAIPMIDRHKSLRPACQAIPAGNRLYALDPDETTRAVVPFYTGRYVERVTDPEAVAGAGASVILGPRNKPEDRDRCRRLFPTATFEGPPGHAHPLWIYSR